jgi:hypothetical protein
MYFVYLFCLKEVVFQQNLGVSLDDSSGNV